MSMLAVATAAQAAPLTALADVLPQTLIRVDALTSGQSLAQVQVQLFPHGKHDEKPKKSAAQAVREALKRYDGKVLSVTRDGDSFRIKLLHNGNLRIVQVPAD
ncbi:MAG: hypothetical protein L0H19_03065 [Salinisphaera sp.]|nr:hypothetical protein [Salinisphaera sp.]